MSIKEEFEIKFTNEEYDNINNVGELIELIYKKIRIRPYFFVL
jgi:acyl carrier protein